MSRTALLVSLSLVLLSAGCKKRKPPAELRAEAAEQTRAALTSWLDGAPKEEVVATLREAAKSKVEVAVVALLCFGEVLGKRGAVTPVSDAQRQRACVNLAVDAPAWLRHPKPLGVLWRGAGPGVVDLDALPQQPSGDGWWCATFETQTTSRQAGNSTYYQSTSSASRCALGRDGCDAMKAAMGQLGAQYGACRPMHPDFRNTAECLTARGADGVSVPACTVTDCALLQKQLRAAGAVDVSACVLWKGRPLPPPTRPLE